MMGCSFELKSILVPILLRLGSQNPPQIEPTWLKKLILKPTPQNTYNLAGFWRPSWGQVGLTIGPRGDFGGQVGAKWAPKSVQQGVETDVKNMLEEGMHKKGGLLF